MKIFHYFLPSWLKNRLPKKNSGELEEVAGAAGEGEVEEDFSETISDEAQQVNLSGEERKIRPKAQILAEQLFYQEEFRCAETVRQLSEDLELANETIKEYVALFRFEIFLGIYPALQRFLRVFWPDDETKIQDLLITHFSHRFLTCIGGPLSFQPAVYKLCWAILMLNADLHGGHKGRKMTDEEFIANLDSEGPYYYAVMFLIKIYDLVKTEPLTAFKVKTERQAADKKETSVPEGSGSNSACGTDNNPTTTVYKTGTLICKRVNDEKGRKTRKGQRAWKPFTAVLKGMVLHLQKDASDLCEADNKNAIRLHHAVAYPIYYEKRAHVLCLRTADSRLFYFQAESEVEQASWIAIIDRIAARYTAPPLISASHNKNVRCAPVLPSYPSKLSLEQQLEHHKDQLRPRDNALDHVEQEVMRYTTYVRALQELAVEEGVSG